jgi:hypothetical protein
VDSDRILGLIYFIVFDDHVYLGTIGRNVAVQYEGSVGQKLMRLLENLTRQLKRSEIKLDSLDTSVSWYDDKLGYEESGQPYSDGIWGVLTPKVKRL